MISISIYRALSSRREYRFVSIQKGTTSQYLTIFLALIDADTITEDDKNVKSMDEDIDDDADNNDDDEFPKNVSWDSKCKILY